MFGWIERIFQWGVSNIGGTIVGWVRDIIHGLYGFLHSVFGSVADGWSDFWKDANHLWHAAGRFADQVFWGFWHIIRHLIPDLIKWAARELDHVRKWAEHIWSWVVRHVERLVSLIEWSIKRALAWVVHHVFDPLFKFISTAWHWITHFGKIVWFYIDHPAKLIDLVWDFLLAKLEREAWKIGHLLGNFFLGLVLHNIKRFALLIEDIIVSLI